MRLEQTPDTKRKCGTFRTNLMWCAHHNKTWLQNESSDFISYQYVSGETILLVQSVKDRLKMGVICIGAAKLKWHTCGRPWRVHRGERAHWSPVGASTSSVLCSGWTLSVLCSVWVSWSSPLQPGAWPPPGGPPPRSAQTGHGRPAEPRASRCDVVGHWPAQDADYQDGNGKVGRRCAPKDQKEFLFIH